VFKEEPASHEFVVSNIRPGETFVQAAFKTPKGALLFSPVTSVRADIGKSAEVSLELRPGILLAGRVDDAVPRPIRNARIGVYVAPLPDDEHGDLLWSDAQPLREDGTFEFASLPAGRMRVLVLADGWMSKLESSGIMVPRPWSLSHVTDSRTDVIVPMVPASSCEVTVLDKDGQPVAGAQVMAWPNISKTAFGNWILDIYEPSLADSFATQTAPWKEIPYWRTYKGTTDANGKALITQLPPGDRQTMHIYPPKVAPDSLKSAPLELMTEELKPGESGKLIARLK
jgi:hypothetical protein